ncbi:MAG: phosphate acyltransferase PlsX [Chloroflexota bacterium]
MSSSNGASTTTTVAVDAMGGDFAPDEVLKGAVEAHRRGISVVLVGQKQRIRPRMRELGVDLPVVHADDVVTMDEGVGAARRETTSLRVAAELVSSGDADAVVSCGNSAAIMAIALRAWRTLPGIDRPAFGSYLPARNGAVFVLDIGANSTVKASNLVQFAVMGNVYVSVSRDVAEPRVALLSNGTEDTKGTVEVKEANQALRKLDINFIGNVEGNHVFEGSVDVVVCDGFTGNVLLKGGEGVVSEVFDLLKEELNRDLVSRLAAAALMPAFARIKERVNYETYGGAPVLGVNEVMINCHGRSKARAVANGIVLAERLARERLVDRIRDGLQHEDVAVGRGRKLARSLHLRHE